jgi:C4-dicarboxylate-specific signal transduction histidine kinase
MSKENIATVIKILESLPDAQQERIIEHLRDYIADIEDKLKWDQFFRKTQNKLVEAAKLAKQQIAQGQGQAMDYDQL